MTVNQSEMHPSRWGDPGRARPLPAEARGLVEMVFGVDDRPAVEHPALAPSTLAPELVAAHGRDRFLLEVAAAFEAAVPGR